MFGTEMKLTTLIFLIIMTIIFFNSLYSSVRSKYAPSAVRFTKLTFFFILYNFFSGIFPDENIPINNTIQLIVAYLVGINMAIYYAYYIYKEFDIKPFPYLSIRHLILFIGGAFVLCFVFQLLLTGDLENARKSFAVIPILLGGLFLYRISHGLWKLYRKSTKSDQKYYRNRIIGGYVALMSICILPVIVFSGDFQVLEQSVVNAGYFWLTFVLTRQKIYRSQKRIEFLKRIGYLQIEGANNAPALQTFDALSFSLREIEIANYILDGKSYSEIAENLFIAKGTATKHASNMFKKAGVSNRKEFINQFRK